MVNMALTYIKDTVTLIYDGEDLVAFYRQNSILKHYKAELLSAAGLDKITGADRPQIRIEPEQV